MDMLLAAAFAHAKDRAQRDQAVMYVWRIDTPEVRVAVRHHESGAPWISGARSVHIFTVYPDGRVLPSENETEVRS